MLIQNSVNPNKKGKPQIGLKVETPFWELKTNNRKFQMQNQEIWNENQFQLIVLPVLLIRGWIKQSQKINLQQISPRK